MPDATAAPKPARRGLGVIFLTLFLDLVGFSIIFPLFPAMLQHYLLVEGGSGPLADLVALLSRIAPESGGGFAVTALFGGVLSAAFSLVQFLAAPFWGRLSDRVGRRPVLLATILLGLLANLLWVFAAAFPVLVISRLLAGFAAGNLSVATAVVADLTPPERRSRGMALVGVAFGMGFVTGPAIGALGSQIDLGGAAPATWLGLGLHPFSGAALAAGVLAAVNLVWFALRFRESLPDETRAASSARRAEGGPERPAPLPIRRLVGVQFAFILAFSAMEFSITFLAAERLGYGPMQNARLFLFLGFVLLLVQGGFVRRIRGTGHERRWGLIGLGASLLAFAAFALARDELVFHVGLALLGVSAGLANPMLTALVSLHAPADEQGRHLGSFRAAGSLARAAGPLLGGLAYWSLGATALYAIAAAWTLIPLVLLARVPSVPR